MYDLAAMLANANLKKTCEHDILDPKTQKKAEKCN